MDGDSSQRVSAVIGDMDLDAGVESDDASVDFDVESTTRQDSAPGCSSTPRIFSVGTTQLLENLYAGGMKGWGKAHTGDIEMAISATGLNSSQIKNWIRRKNMKRKAADAKVLSLPKPKKRNLTAWNLHLKKCAATEDGRQALQSGKVVFNQKASSIYRQMSDPDKEQLREAAREPIAMTVSEQSKRCRRIFNRMNEMFGELEDLGHCGFAVAFKGGSIQLMGRPAVLNNITPQLLEYLHGIVVTAYPPTSASVTPTVRTSYETPKPEAVHSTARVSFETLKPVTVPSTVGMSNGGIPNPAAILSIGMSSEMPKPVAVPSTAPPTAPKSSAMSLGLTAHKSSVMSLGETAPKSSTMSLAPTAPKSSAMSLGQTPPKSSAMSLGQTAPKSSAMSLAPTAPKSSAMSLAPTAPKSSAMSLGQTAPKSSAMSLGQTAPKSSAMSLGQTAPKSSAMSLAPTAPKSSAMSLAPTAPKSSAMSLGQTAPKSSAMSLAPTAPKSSAMSLGQTPPKSSAMSLAPTAPKSSAMSLAPTAPKSSAMSLGQTPPKSSAMSLGQTAPKSSAMSLAPTAPKSSVMSLAPAAPKLSTHSNYWLSSLGLLQSDHDVLCTNKWINDTIVYAAQSLLKQQFSGVFGLQSPQCGRNLSFRAVPPGKRYVQILHIDSNHWVMASNIHFATTAVANDRALLYDSNFRRNISQDVKRQICALVRTPVKRFWFDVVNTSHQPNSYDCGVIAIANATEVLHGENPAKCVWDYENVRKHLITCFEGGRMDRFPVLRERRLTLGGFIKFFHSEHIHCVCRMPEDDFFGDMIECSLCQLWFHASCVGIQNVKEYGKNKKWFCCNCTRLMQ